MINFVDTIINSGAEDMKEWRPDFGFLNAVFAIF